MNWTPRLCGRRLALFVCAVTGLLGAAGWGCGFEVCGSSDLEAVRARLRAAISVAPPLSADPDAGLAQLADWSALPHLGSDRYEQFSSHNRQPGAQDFEPGGKDFNNFLAASGAGAALPLMQVDGPDAAGDALGGYVLAAVDDGPGFVSRIFLTRCLLTDVLAGARFFERTDLGRFEGEVLRIFVDDLAQPVLEMPVADLGQSAPFEAPLAGRTSGATVSYTPISFQQRLRVVLANTCPLSAYFYHVDVQHMDGATRPFSPRLAEDPVYVAAVERIATASISTSPWLPEQSFEIAPGSSAEAFADTTGGTLTALRVIADGTDPAALANLALQVFYEGAGEPAFDLPLDVFCGAREQLAPLHTLPLSVDYAAGQVTAELRLPMPFRQSLRVAVRNGGSSGQQVRVQVGLDRTLPPEPWGYLHARSFTVAGPQPPGSQFEALGVAGRGRYVGTFLFAAGHGDPRTGQSRAALSLLEGNETGLIDGARRIPGTGTEDYFNGGFYFCAGAFDSPFAAANVVRGGFDADPGVASCCRWHVLGDTIDFTQSFTLRFQYGADNPALVERYATAAYYYLDRPAPGAVTGGNVTPAP